MSSKINFEAFAGSWIKLIDSYDGAQLNIQNGMDGCVEIYSDDPLHLDAESCKKLASILMRIGSGIGDGRSVDDSIANAINEYL